MDELELKNGSPWILQDIKKVFQELWDHYRVIKSRNEYLEEEIKRIKSDTYKDEELSKMKEDYERMKKNYYRGFPISEKEEDKIDKWQNKIIEKYPANTGAIGGRFIYKFLPTSIGTSGLIIDSVSGETFEFQEIV